MKYTVFACDVCGDSRRPISRLEVYWDGRRTVVDVCSPGCALRACSTVVSARVAGVKPSNDEPNKNLTTNVQ
jgi:hypothetical protein